MPKLQKEKTKKVIRYWRSGNIYPPNITDQLDKIIDNAINNLDGGMNNDQVRGMSQVKTILYLSIFCFT